MFFYILSLCFSIKKIIALSVFVRIDMIAIKLS
nr:MAG TPA: hypothetical protein [Caudoviricetes sp.]